MAITTESDITTLVRSDSGMMHALRLARSLDLPNWWIGAGFLRNRVWDAISGSEVAEMTDIDLVYFDKSDTSPETDWKYDERLHQQDPKNIWEVRNQARMHYVNGFKPFVSTEDGIAHWTETATAIGVRLVGDELDFLYCYGSDDLLKMIARPTPHIEGELLPIFQERMKKKNWQKRWPALRVETI